MSPYRKRFVQFNMLLIGIVLTVMVAAVAVYMVNDYYNSLRVTMEQVVAPLQGFSQPPKGEPPREKPDQERAEQKRSFRLRESSFVMRQGGWTVSAVPWWGRPSYTRSRGYTPFRFFVCGIPC